MTVSTQTAVKAGGGFQPAATEQGTSSECSLDGKNSVAFTDKQIFCMLAGAHVSIQ